MGAGVAFRVPPDAVALRRGRQRQRPPASPALPIYHSDFLPSLKRERAAVVKLRARAAEFDALDEERYTALQFVELGA